MQFVAMKGGGDFSSMIIKSAKVLTVLAMVEGIIASLVYFSLPDLAKQAWLFGISKERILGSAFYLLPVLLLAVMLFVISRRPAIQKALTTRAVAFAGREEWQDFFFLACGVFVGFAVTIGELVLIQPLHQPGFVEVMAPRYFPWVVWGLLVTLQTIVFYRIAASPRKIDLKRGLTYGFYWLLFILIGWHWTLLIFRLHYHKIFGEWLWGFNYDPVDLARILPALALTAAGVFLFWLLQPKKPGAKILILLFVVGYLGQFLLLNFGGNIFRTAQATFLNRPVMGVLISACKADQGALPIIGQYDDLFKDEYWVVTKAPGFLLFYTAFRDATFTVAPLASQDCLGGLADGVSIVFPLFAVIALIPMYAIWRNFRPRQAFLPGLLYIFTPNIVYFMMTADQAIYPLAFTLFLWLMLYVAKERPWWVSLAVGGILYLLVFFSFSLLPLLGAIIIWAGLNIISSHSPSQRKYWWVSLVLILIGFAILYLVFLYGFHYDPILRYSNAFDHHRTNKDFSTDFGQFTWMVFLNNFEFALFVGIPMFVLFFMRMVSAIVAFFRKDWSLENLFAITLLAVFVALNVLGQTRGEVGRIWIFMVPAVLLLAVQELRELPLRHDLQYPLLAALQVITTLLFMNAYVIY